METNKRILGYHKIINYAIVFALLIIGITLLVLPADFFDNGPPMCVSVLLFDIECYGCGMTRAIQHIIHFEFEKAFQYNKLSFVVFPLFVYMIIWELRKRFKEANKK